MRPQLTLLAAACIAGQMAAQSVPDLKVPPGFVVTEFAGDDLAHDIVAMTFNPEGQIVVAGRGYIKTLIDDNGDGRADRAVLVTDVIKSGAMGLLWEGDCLFATGDSGLNRFRVSPDGRASGPPEVMVRLKATGEHDAHAVKRGGDGHLYWLCGNMAGVSELNATGSTSPIRKPIAGALLRLAPDFRACEIVAHGFRNAYDFDFDDTGTPWTFDSDNERCIGLPWYEGCRIYRIRRGGFYGWLAPQFAQTWRMPPYFPDVERPVVDLGRGSPTGVACYRHRQFPERYRGSVFAADWTFGRIWCIVGERAEPFLETTGDRGFAPTGMAVHPTTGDLWVTIGGRGTRGGVFRITYPAGASDAANFRTSKVPPMPASSPALRSPLEQRTAQGISAADAAIAAARTAQRHLGDIGNRSADGTVWEGYTPRDDNRRLSDESKAHLRSIMSDLSGDAAREVSRALAMIEDDDAATLRHIVARLMPSSHPIDDIHYLIVAARLKAPRNPAMTHAIAEALVGLDRKLVDRHLSQDRNWPLRMAEVHAELAKKDSTLNAAILAHPDFARPGNAVLTRCPGFDKAAAAERFLTKSLAPGFTWTGEVVRLLDSLLPERYAPLLDPLWERGGLESDLLVLMAKHPRLADRSKFVDGLRSRQLEQMALCLTALKKLPATNDPSSLVPLVRALRSLSEGKAEAPVREQLASYLQSLTGQNLGPDRKAWTDWLVRTHPEHAAGLSGADGVDMAAWTKRLAGLDWAIGNAERGKTVFTKVNCAACHSGGTALGPDLRGVASRFGRDDLLTAILLPSKDVSPRYRATQISTRDGKTYLGLIVYEATDGVILQTGADATVRIEGPRIESRGMSDVSLMPAGLIDRLTDAEIADLLAYLRALK